jgi:uncharacterized protein YbaA (DUF1428 family)
MSYVDGFVVVVPNKNLESYFEMAKKAGKIWKKHGAIDYKECVADDVSEKDYCTTFTKISGQQEDETVVFAYITYLSRDHRDEVNTKVINDPELAEICDPNNNLFDCKRMAYGGFKTMVNL